MPKPAPTLSILDLMRAAQPPSQPEGMTIREIVNAANMPDTRAIRGRMLDKIRPLVASGKVIVAMAVRTDICGRPLKSPVYRAVKK